MKDFIKLEVNEDDIKYYNDHLKEFFNKLSFELADERTKEIILVEKQKYINFLEQQDLIILFNPEFPHTVFSYNCLQEMLYWFGHFAGILDYIELLYPQGKQRINYYNEQLKARMQAFDSKYEIK